MFTLLSIRISLSPLSLSRLSSSVLLTRTHKLVVSPLRVQFDTELRDNNSQYINDQSLQVHPLSFDFFFNILSCSPFKKEKRSLAHTHTDRETCLFFIDSKILAWPSSSYSFFFIECFSFLSPSLPPTVDQDGAQRRDHLFFLVRFFLLVGCVRQSVGRSVCSSCVRAVVDVGKKTASGETRYTQLVYKREWICSGSILTLGAAGFFSVVSSRKRTFN